MMQNIFKKKSSNSDIILLKLNDNSTKNLTPWYIEVGDVKADLSYLLININNTLFLSQSAGYDL